MLTLKFSVVDYVIFGGMLAISFAIGIFYAFKASKTNEDYLMGGRSIGILPIAISICASFNSAYMILGIPNEIYTYGTQFTVTIVGIGVGILFAGEVWIPILYRLKVVSIYEYFELRYKSKFPRRLMTGIFILKTVLYLAIVLYAPTIALSSVTDLPWWVSILLLGLCTTVYTALGGILAIVWTDVFQIFIIVGGLLAILIKGLMQTGGLAKVWSVAQDGGRIEFFNLSLDIYERHTFWNVLFGSVILWGSPYTCSQYLVQRCLCLETITKAKISLYINYLGQIFLFTVVGLIGLILYAYYVECDPLLAGVVKRRDAIISIFVLQEFVEYYGIPGLFISCLFSGALSTLDSAMHALATVTWEELKTISCLQGISSKKETAITKIISMCYGLLAMGMSFICSSLGSLISLGGKVFGATMGPMFAYVIVSILFPFVNLVGSSLGLVLGQGLNIWLSLGSSFTPQTHPELIVNATNCTTRFGTDDFERVNATLPDYGPRNEFNDIYRLSYNLYPIIGFVATFLLCILCSVATGGIGEMKTADRKYFNPTVWKLYGGLVTNNESKVCNDKS